MTEQLYRFAWGNNTLHAEHIKICDTILGLERIERFRKEGERILGRKVTFIEAAELLGCKFKKDKA